MADCSKKPDQPVKASVLLDIIAYKAPYPPFLCPVGILDIFAPKAAVALFRWLLAITAMKIHQSIFDTVATFVPQGIIVH
jgi:hypothetical protein